MMKIGVIAHLRHAIREPFAGGLEMHTHALCHRLRKSGHQVSLFAASGSQEAGLEAISDPLPISERSFAAEHRCYLQLMVDLRNRDFDIIHNNSLHYLPVAMAATLPMPIVSILHTPPFWELEGCMRLSDTHKNAFVAVSEVVRRAWQPIVPVECVVANGIDLDLFAFREVPDVEQYVLWHGRIVPEKGLHLAIDAARLAGLALRFAGPVADRTYYQQQIEPRMSGAVRYLGHLSHADLVAVIGGARAVLCTPLWEEPYGLVVAEALACGTPVAAFARGAVVDLLDHDCGVLVEPDDLRGLAEAAASAQHLDRRACRNRAAVIGDARTMMVRYEQLYGDMIARHPRSKRIQPKASPVACIEPTNASLIDLYSRRASTMLCRLPVNEAMP